MSERKYNEILSKSILRGKLTNHYTVIEGKKYYEFDTGISRYLIESTEYKKLEYEFSKNEYLDITAENLSIAEKDRLKLGSRYDNILRNIECRGVV